MKRVMCNLDSLLQNLEQNAWAFADHLLPEDLEKDLFAQGRQAWEAGLFQEAHIGRGITKARQEEIRGDSILWLEPGTPGSASDRFLAWAEDFRCVLNQEYFLGLRSAEFHFARYPQGKAYQKHLDQHRGSPARKISLVLYLNPQWAPEDGGELCLYSPETEEREIGRVLPQGGRLVVFRSDLIPHEVLPCAQTRWSLTGWFRDDYIAR